MRVVRPRRHARRWGASALLSVAVLLAGCGDDGSSIAAQARAGDEKGYIAGDGSIQQLDPADRDTTIELAGTTLEGQEWSSLDLRGQVIVLNVWGSWCGPCQAEAPALEQVYDDFGAGEQQVSFIGVNDRDSVASALAFQKAEGISYPSLADDGGQTLLALQGLAPYRPTTLVLDRKGRVAARVGGQVDAATLTGLVQDVLEPRG